MMLRFVVHLHLANKSGKHYDLRLETKSGKLLSFAVRKGIPKKPNVKHLAVRTEDHEKKWLTFEGEIKSGYGAGKIKIYDRGSYELNKMTADVIDFVLHGNKFKGRYILYRFDKKHNLYYLFKTKDKTKN